MKYLCVDHIHMLWKYIFLRSVKFSEQRRFMNTSDQSQRSLLKRHTTRLSLFQINSRTFVLKVYHSIIGKYE